MLRTGDFLHNDPLHLELKACSTYTASICKVDTLLRPAFLASYMA